MTWMFNTIQILFLSEMDAWRAERHTFYFRYITNTSLHWTFIYTFCLKKLLPNNVKILLFVKKPLWYVWYNFTMLLKAPLYYYAEEGFKCGGTLIQKSSWDLINNGLCRKTHKASLCTLWPLNTQWRKDLNTWVI